MTNLLHKYESFMTSKQNIKKILISINTLAIFLSLSGCSNPTQVETNLDKENFSEYFKAGAVDVYSAESEFKTEYKFIGLVEGDSCKERQNDQPANEVDARTMARKRAADKGANAVIFTSCTIIEDQQCIEAMVCYGKAFTLLPTD